MLNLARGSQRISQGFEALERRRLLTGVAPETIAGYTFDLEMDDGPSLPFLAAAAYRLLAAPVSNAFFLDNLDGVGFIGSTSGTYGYSRQSASIAQFTFDDAFIEAGFGTLSFTTNTTGRITISDGEDSQNGSFSLISTVAPAFHFHPDDDGRDGLVGFGTNGNDAIGLSIDSAGKLRYNLNGAVAKFDPSAVLAIVVIAGDGADGVTIGGGLPVESIDPDRPTGVYIDGGAGNDTLAGGNGNDTITGGGGKNTLFGNDGNDRLAGSGGRDLLRGGNGNDRLYGNGGDDTLLGEGNVDRLFGGVGNDSLVGGKSNDKLYGEAGDDTLIGGLQTDLLNGGAGLDSAMIDAGESSVDIETLL